MGLEVYGHIEVPANDACISLGQAWIGARKIMPGQDAENDVFEKYCPLPLPISFLTGYEAVNRSGSRCR